MYTCIYTYAQVSVVCVRELLNVAVVILSHLYFIENGKVLIKVTIQRNVKDSQIITKNSYAYIYHGEKYLLTNQALSTLA